MANQQIKIGLARFPYSVQHLRGGDYLLFDKILKCLDTQFDVEEIRYMPPCESIIQKLPAIVKRVVSKIANMLIPWFYTYQLYFRHSRNFDLIIADSAVLVSVPLCSAHRNRIVGILNIDYAHYYQKVSAHLNFKLRTAFIWKAKLQDSGLSYFRCVAVSASVMESVRSRHLPIPELIANTVDLPEVRQRPSKVGRCFFAGSSDFIGKGMDILEQIIAAGIDIDTFTPCYVRGANSLGVLPHADLLERMSNYDVFVFPSRYESFGLTVVEAWAQGVPVVMHNTGVGTELIKLVPELILDDSASLGNWLDAIQYAHQHRDKLCAIVRPWLIQYTDQKRFQRQWLELITKMLQDQHKN